MKQPFTPLVVGSPGVAGGPKPSAAFATLGHGHESATGVVDAKPGANPAPASASPAGISVEEPRVTLQREGDRITGITIHCMCGQVLNLSCSY